MIVTLTQSVNLMPEWRVIEAGQAADLDEQMARALIVAGLATEGGVLPPSDDVTTERAVAMPQRETAPTATATATAAPQRKPKRG